MRLFQSIDGPEMHLFCQMRNINPKSWGDFTPVYSTASLYADAGRDTHGSHFPQRNYTHYVVLQIDVEPSVASVFDFDGAKSWTA